MSIAIVCGSIRENSSTHYILTRVQIYLIKKGINVDFIDFKKTILPMFDGSPSNKELAMDFIEKMDKADGFIIGSPEYHNSFSGVLKNAFDFLSSSQIKNKPIGILSVSGGGKGGINCLNAMRLFLRGLYGLVLPNQVVIDERLLKDNLINEDMEVFEKVYQLIDEVVDLSTVLKYSKKQPS